MATAKLMVQGGPDDGLEVELKAGGTTLGRDGANDVVAGWDGSVSRHHARITQYVGLYWLEDLGSTNGTFLRLAGEEKQRLVPQQPLLLQDGAALRLGFRARYEVQGVIPNTNDAMRLLRAYLQRALDDLSAGLLHLSKPEMQQRQQAQIDAFIQKLAAAQSEDELLHLAAEGIPTLAGQQAGDDGAAPLLDWGEQPPLSDDVPEPDDPNRVPSLRNVFIADIQTWQRGAGEGGQA